MILAVLIMVLPAFTAIQTRHVTFSNVAVNTLASTTNVQNYSVTSTATYWDDVIMDISVSFWLKCAATRNKKDYWITLTHSATGR